MEKENEDYYEIPENIHTTPPSPPTDGKWKFLGVAGAKG